MYLSKITITNYKGIQHLEVNFSSKINVIIGENGAKKSALIDAIRLLYNVGDPLRELTVTKEDFYEEVSVDKSGILSINTSDLVTISYEFKGLSSAQQGAFYEYMVIDSKDRSNDYARIELRYKMDKYNPKFYFFTGIVEGQKADYNTFQLFQHYYLSAIRDSTKDLLTTRGNLLGKVIKRLVVQNQTEDTFKDIIKDANDQLLKQPEVQNTKGNINNNLKSIYKYTNDNQIGLRIDQSRIEYIVNVIKPYLPHDVKNNSAEGFNLIQNSLGFNNLMYIATVLGDIKERIKEDPIPHFALLIEEPEAHIHPQLQLSLYNFLKESNSSDNSQLFITTHSPTLTSKVPFSNLIVLDNDAYTIENIFNDRAKEDLVQDTSKGTLLSEIDIVIKKNQLQRYIDVTKSQLFFAKSCLFVEGISEELLLSAFCKVEGFSLEDYSIELVNVGGVSFYPFMFLFNSIDDKRRLPKKVAIVTDDDRYPASKKKEYKIERLIENGYLNLSKLHQELNGRSNSNRVKNIESIANNQSNISINTAFQTLEYALCLSNMKKNIIELQDSFLYKFLKNRYDQPIYPVDTYLESLGTANIIEEEKEKIAILMWKCMPSKADFAQDFSLHIIEHIQEAKESFIVPEYIVKAFNHLKI
ncbi:MULTISPECIES: ATP-dependent nuclease [unclassified Myroides]|uniref:ATP-dependent nuclease n=1 Tax=unclassified Myroides TaxID=2642485 RepID=UPI0031019E8E